MIIESNAPTPDFQPGGNDSCYCGSSKFFTDCCGSTEAIRPPPYGLFMFENYLDAEFVKELTSFANQRDGQRLMVINNDESTPDNIVKAEDQRRVAERVDLGERRQEIKHADSQNMDVANRTWSKIIDRDLSLLIYLNDGYEGGELSFYKLNYQIRPRAGAVVLFPSDHRFLHQAETVKKGVRYAIVSWASVKGIEKVAQNPPGCAIFVE